VAWSTVGKRPVPLFFTFSVPTWTLVYNATSSPHERSTARVLHWPCLLDIVKTAVVKTAVVKIAIVKMGIAKPDIRASN